MCCAFMKYGSISMNKTCERDRHNQRILINILLCVCCSLWPNRIRFVCASIHIFISIILLQCLQVHTDHFDENKELEIIYCPCFAIDSLFITLFAVLYVVCLQLKNAIQMNVIATPIALPRRKNSN